MKTTREPVDRRRSGRTLAAIALVLLILFVVGVPYLLNGERLRRETVDFLEKSTGKKVEIGRLSLTLFPRVAIRVTEFGIMSPPLFPSSYLLKVARIDARIDLWSLLRRPIVIHSLTLDRPVINLVSDPDGPWNFENPAAKNRPRSLSIGVISSVTITGGHFLASNLLPSDAAGPVFFEARNVSSELQDVNPEAIANPASATFDGHGTLQAELLRFGSIEVKDLRSTIRLQAKQVVFTGVEAAMYGGATKGEFTMDLSRRQATFKARATMTRIDMAKFLDAFKNARGKMTGTMDSDLAIDGAIAHSQRPWAGMHGSGHVTVRNGQVPSLKLNANLMKLAHYNDLGPAKDDPSSFNLIATDWELDHEHISSKAIDIDGYGVDVDGSGNVSISGSDELNYRGVAAIVSKQGVVTQLFARMAGGTLKDGKLLFPFHIMGTIENPAFTKGE